MKHGSVKLPGATMSSNEKYVPPIAIIVKRIQRVQTVILIVGETLPSFKSSDSGSG